MSMADSLVADDEFSQWTIEKRCPEVGMYGHNHNWLLAVCSTEAAENLVTAGLPFILLHSRRIRQATHREIIMSRAPERESDVIDPHPWPTR